MEFLVGNHKIPTSAPTNRNVHHPSTHPAEHNLVPHRTQQHTSTATSVPAREQDCPTCPKPRNHEEDIIPRRVGFRELRPYSTRCQVSPPHTIPT